MFEWKLSPWQVYSAVPLSGVLTCATWMRLSHWFFDMDQLSPERVKGKRLNHSYMLCSLLPFYLVFFFSKLVSAGLHLFRP